MPSNESFKTFSEVNRPRIDKHLKAVLRLHQLQAKSVNPMYSDVVKQLNVLISRGGKRIRPLLFLIAYRGYGGRRTSCALELAVSQELLHAFLLIHDDVIDRDFVRWGGPNIGAVYFDRYSQTMDAREALHMAESVALLAGNVCMTLAYERISASGMDNHTILDFQKCMQQAVLRVTAGELAEVTFVQSKKIPSKAEVLAMYSAKTASYSFALPLQLGALAAGAAEQELELLTNIAESLGIAFQLYDDILGLFGDEKIIGKPVMSDVREGKRTLLVVHALEQVSATERKTLLEILDGNDTSPASLALASEIIVSSGARDYAQALITKHVASAIEGINKTSLSLPHKHHLIDLARNLTIH